MCKPRKRRNCSNALFVEQCYIDFIVKHNNLYRHWNEKKNLFVQAYQSCELLAWICRVLPNGEEFLKSKKEALVTMCEDCSKVEKILKCSLDSIISPSPSAKIQIMGGKICLRCKGCWMLSTNFWKQKVCRQCPAIFCLYTSNKLCCI